MYMLRRSNQSYLQRQALDRQQILHRKRSGDLVGGSLVQGLAQGARLCVGFACQQGSDWETKSETGLSSAGKDVLSSHALVATMRESGPQCMSF